MQIQGMWGSRGVYYRARDGRWQLYVNPDGPADTKWLSGVIDDPDDYGTFENPADETRLDFAMDLIVRAVGG